MDKELTTLHQKVDTLVEQMAFLTEQAQSQQRRTAEGGSDPHWEPAGTFDHPGAGGDRH